MSEKEGKDGGNRAALRVVLFVLLGLMVFALYWDRGVARPGVEKAYKEIEELNRRVNATAGTATMTTSEVQEIVGKPPSEVIEHSDKHPPYKVEVYKWSSGLPFKSHKLYAVYSPEGTLKSQFKYEFEEETLWPPDRVARRGRAENVDDNSTDEFADDPDEIDAPAGGGGGGGGGRSGGRRGSFDPAAFFSRMDENEDGKLVGEEIPERARERMMAADTNQDGAITLEELQANPPQFERRGGGGGGGGDRRSGRPEPDDDGQPPAEAQEGAQEGDQEKPEQADEAPEGDKPGEPVAGDEGKEKAEGEKDPDQR